jgi:outer membrane protein TolC
LIHRKNALQNLSKSIESSYYPNIKIEDSYTFFGYAKRPYFSGKPIPLLDEQNKISATLSLRVFDFGTLRQKKEVLKLQAAALQEEISYKSKEQKINITISRKRITTAKLNIESTRSALKAAKETLHTITKKYKAGIVDNVVYLDALATHTAAKALYEKSRNDLEIAYALYYYYNAKNLEEFLQ